MFIMVMSARASLDHTVEVMLAHSRYDVMMVLSHPYRATHLIETTESVAGVTRVEVWDQRNAQLSLESGEKVEIGVIGLPPDTEVLQLRVLSGRWLSPDDGRAILLNSKLAADRGFHVGDEVTLAIAGEESTWTVVGLVLNVGITTADTYVRFGALSQETGDLNRGGMVMVMSREHDARAQERLIDALSDVCTVRRVEVKVFQSAHQFRERGQELFDIISGLLLTMAFLAAVVGGVGLMGTLSINVVERQREIGVMRAIGGQPSAIVGIFIGEGIALGLLSWLLAVPLSYPGARVFSDVIGITMFSTALDFRFSASSVVIWLGLVVVLSVLASLWPALRATRVSVREALAYE